MLEADYDSIIQALEEEQLRLRILITEQVKDEEYLLAHYHSEALYKVNGQIQILKTMDNPLYPDISGAERSLKMLQVRLAKENSGYMAEYWQRGIDKEVEKLNELYERSSTERAGSTFPILSEALYKLVVEEIHSIKLTLQKSTGLAIEMIGLKEEIEVTILAAEDHTYELFHEELIDILGKVGFNKTDQRNRFTSFVSKNTNPYRVIMDLLIKIIFETFHYREFENDSYLEVIK